LAQGESYGLPGVQNVQLTLGSDSASILCGAGLVYSGSNCEQVICYTQRNFHDAIIHSGDQRKNGKSEHVIQLKLFTLPPQVDQLYFTLCSCGPADLSGFQSPHILLAEESSPDQNLCQYSLDGAAQAGAPSALMARISRVGGAKKWIITALGLNSGIKCCGNYSEIKRQIAELHNEQTGAAPKVPQDEKAASAPEAAGAPEAVASWEPAPTAPTSWESAPAPAAAPAPAPAPAQPVPAQAQAAPKKQRKKRNKKR